MSEEITKTETMEDFKEELEASFKTTPEWAELVRKLESKEIFPVTIESAVKAGVTATVEGIRGFIPASRIGAGYVEDLESVVGQTIDVCVITAEPAGNRLVLSGREAARAKQAAERKAKMEALKVGAVVEGTVETIQPYGAFVALGDGMTGLVHISQMSLKRVKDPADVVKVGDTVTAKIVSLEKGKIGLSMKALLAPEEPAEEPAEAFHYKEEGKATTNLGSLFAGLKL